MDAIDIPPVQDANSIDASLKETSDTIYHMVNLSVAITKKALAIEAKEQDAITDTLQNVALDKVRRNLGL
nr:MAG TPA: hypothetical protein [Caudoviricetes sp.]